MLLGKASEDGLLRWLSMRAGRVEPLKNFTVELIYEQPNQTINICEDGPKILIIQNIEYVSYCYTHDQWVERLWSGLKFSAFHYPIIVLNLLIFLIGTTGNIFVCLSVKRNHQLRNVTNYFIVNLAFADFLVILICLPATVVWDLSLTWFFDTIPCKLIMFLQDVSISVSVLTLTAISIDRYYAICHPLRFKTSLSQAKRIIALIWLVSLAIMVPDLIYLRALPSDDLSQAGLTTVLYSDCNYDWSTEASRAFQFVKTILLYLLPFLLMLCAHYRILLALRLASTLMSDSSSTYCQAHSVGADLRHAHRAEPRDTPRDTAHAHRAGARLASQPDLHANYSDIIKPIELAELIPAGTRDERHRAAGAVDLEAPPAHLHHQHHHRHHHRHHCEHNHHQLHQHHNHNSHHLNHHLHHHSHHHLHQNQLQHHKHHHKHKLKNCPTNRGRHHCETCRTRTLEAETRVEGRTGSDLVSQKGAASERIDKKGEGRVEQPAGCAEKSEPSNTSSTSGLQSGAWTLCELHQQQPSATINKNKTPTSPACRKLTTAPQRAGSSCPPASTSDDQTASCGASDATSRSDPSGARKSKEYLRRQRMLQELLLERDSFERPANEWDGSKCVKKFRDTRRATNERLKWAKTAPGRLKFISDQLRRPMRLAAAASKQKQPASEQAHELAPLDEALELMNCKTNLTVLEVSSSSSSSSGQKEPPQPKDDDHQRDQRDQREPQNNTRKSNGPTRSLLKRRLQPGGQPVETRASLAGTTGATKTLTTAASQPASKANIALNLCELDNTANMFMLTMHNKSKLESRQKAAKMLITIVILFGICYLPVHLINFLRQFIDDIPQTDVTSTLSMLAHCVCYLNSAINPIIYNHMNGVFRAEFRKFLSCLDWRQQTVASSHVQAQAQGKAGQLQLHLDAHQNHANLAREEHAAQLVNNNNNDKNNNSLHANGIKSKLTG